MSAEIFRSTMDNNINTEISRYLVNRRSKGVVYHGQNTMFFSQFANIFQIRNIEVWVGRGLYKNELCIWAYSGFESVVICLVYLRHLDAILQQKIAHKCQRCGIMGVLCDNMVATFNDG